MTDFLGRLVSRSLPPRDRPEMRGELSPRLPSLFEPPDVGLGSPEPTQETPPRRLSAVTEYRLSPEEQSPSRTIVPSADTTPSQSRAERRSPEPNAEGMPSGFREDAGLAPPVRKAVSPPAWPQIINHEPAQVAQPGSEPAFTAQSLPGLVPAPHPSLSTGRQDRRLENAAALIDQRSGTRVHINIGRIEVRAVHPPQPPAQPRKTIPQTRLTIEEYSKQRNEGKR